MKSIQRHQLFNDEILSEQEAESSVLRTNVWLYNNVPEQSLVITCVPIGCTFVLGYHFIAARCLHQARPLPSCGVRLSVCLCVCLSVTFVHSVKTGKHIVRLFFTVGRSIILVFLNQTERQQSDADPPPPLTGASNTSGYEKSRFLTNISLYL